MAGTDSGFPGKPGHVYGIWGPLHNYSRTRTVVAIVAAGLGDRSCVMMHDGALAVVYVIIRRCASLRIVARTVAVGQE